MRGELSAAHGSLVDAICAELGETLSPDVKELVSFFLDNLGAAMELGVPNALADQLDWQTRRLRVLAPEMDADRLAQVTAKVIHAHFDDETASKVGNQLRQASSELGRFEGRTAEPMPGELAREYLELALAAMPDRAVDVVLSSGLEPNEVLLKVLEPAQSELGQRWELDFISVAQEHDITELTQRVMSLLRARRQGAPSHGHSVLATMVGGEAHSIGLDMVVDLLEGSGWLVHRLPVAMSAPDLVEEVATREPDVVALSATLLSHVVDVRAVIEALKADPRTRQVPVTVGGRPFRRNPALVVLVGADDWGSDGQGAVDACTRVLSGGQPTIGDVAEGMQRPLESMLGLAALLHEDAGLTHRQRDLAGRILKSGAELMSSIEDLGSGVTAIRRGLGFTQISARVDLDRLVDEVITRHQSKAAGRDIVLRKIDLPPRREPLVVDGDIIQLERVLNTLVDDALTVTPTSGVITVRVKRTGDLASVAVADEDPAQTQRGKTEKSSAADRAAAITGRGLDISRRIAELNGGSLNVVSDHRGSVVTFILPITRAARAVEVPDETTEWPRLSIVREDDAGTSSPA